MHVPAHTHTNTHTRTHAHLDRLSVLLLTHQEEECGYMNPRLGIKILMGKHTQATHKNVDILTYQEL